MRNKSGTTGKAGRMRRFKRHDEVLAFLNDQDKAWKERNTIITKDDVAAFLFAARDRAAMNALIDASYRLLRQASDEEDELILLALGITSRNFYKRVYYNDAAYDLASLEEHMCAALDHLQKQIPDYRRLLTSPRSFERFIGKLLLRLEKKAITFFW